MWLIPSVRRIAFLNCADLIPDIQKMVAAGLSVAVDAEPTLISFFGKASFSSKSSPGNLSAKTSINFTTDRILPSEAPVAFIVELHSGERLLVGTFEPPFPKVECSRDSGASPTDRYGVSVSVSWPLRPAKTTVWLPDDAQLPMS